MILKFDNGSFASISEGSANLGSMVVSLGSGPTPVTTAVIPAKSNALFLKMTAERISTTTRGISVVSGNLKGELKTDSVKALMTEIMEMVRNV